MAVDERARHELHAGLVEVLGDERASTLMSYLPPVGWTAVATRRDLEQLAAVTRRDLEQLAAVTRRDLEQHGAATKRDLAQLGTDLRLEFQRDLGALRADLHADLSRLTRTFFLGLVGANATLAAVAFAAGRIG